MTTRNFKDIKEHIDNLQEIDNNKYLLMIDNSDGTKYALLKEDNHFIMKRSIKENERFDDSDLKHLNINNKELSNDNESYIITNSRFKTHDYIDTVAYYTSSFESAGFRANKYFQLIINATKKNIRLDFIFNNLISISSETSMPAFNGITFKIKNTSFNLYFIHDYFVIENIDELDFHDFDTYSRTILMCYGVLSGYAPGIEGYYFSYTNNDFSKFTDHAYSNSFVGTYDVSYKPVNTNLHYSFLSNNATDQERDDHTNEANKNLFLITNEVFSTLCRLHVENKKIARSVELIMEANQTTLEAQGIVYSVVLEILTSYIAVKNEDKLTPISDKEKAKELQSKLHSVAEPYFCVYKDSPIYKKINSINSPTNMDKLTKSFELLSIPLITIDKKIINNRNNFLHGNDFVEGDELLEFVNNHFYINCKLNFLVYALLLKISGHHGKIVNMVKTFLDHDERTSDEGFYRDIGEKHSNAQ